ncbi:hypothetical protein [Mycobacterium sp. 1274756.6]|uniref:hypothetical protein n=1 Tax=Mycobacterium sp. 1274756.6 TaxID=1834076 RepID=UPI000ACF2C6F|nr:hypothetical protein [Mycobacterium sp. 1274756.6]
MANTPPQSPQQPTQPGYLPPQSRSLTKPTAVLALAILGAGLLAWHPWAQPDPATRPSLHEPATMEVQFDSSGQASGAVKCYSSEAGGLSCVYVPAVR